MRADGYKLNGNIFLKPENGKFYDSRNVKFNEKRVYGDIYRKNSIQDWDNNFEEIDKDKWFIEFDEELEENLEENSKTE